ncbi:lipid IV(A) 3-deoxy-D-manno-octulosonic acid transferase [Methylomicrobium sp. Wu6]|uniref:lipid IV(A) 3-deoxy-D-manno-octulosonic acid transferase n=1 Tax=Methylomicrobium sp. Wu6 TaxID=3107928 RepID=UPI002DD69053|nr:lipid IV(A) 3-deoxy-D-manno-octulosonic acid transferase [Methylomicrobium sp. Wu6]MEC4749386.1 lipid IV(A) 3-deoxy-D-manno-octulosonic acid transferase [Methylomicrobium sp. Wu6]
MFAFYTLLFYLLTPFIMLRLLWRGIKAPAYRQRWNERFGYYHKTYPQDVIWFHAVSVGEAEALFPLLRLLQSRHPDAKLLITTTTPTGSARVQAMFLGKAAHVYLPYDMPFVIGRFLNCFKPRLAVIMETEIWPNLYAACGKQKIPLFLINARLTEKSACGYRRIPSLIRPSLAKVSLIAAQTHDDAERFVSIGAQPETVKVMGNMKFDIDIAEGTIAEGRRLKSAVFGDRFVWIIASTHKNEEALFLDIYPELKAEIPELMLVLVPRHPERFLEVKKLCEERRLNVVMRTSGDNCAAVTDVYIADTMGELKMLYAAADVAFIGGSMVPVGGHNLLEAAAIGVPMMFGPYMSNFKEIAGGVLARNAALQCRTQQDIVSTVLSLYADPDNRSELARRAGAFLQENRGAIAAIAARIETALPID